MLGPHSFAIITQTEQGLFAVDPQDFDVGRQLRKHGEWGESELARLLPYLSPQSQVLVVGAHIGSLVVPLARHSQAVVAIEANPASFELLQLNLKLNDTHNCQPFCVAANHQAETLSFLVNPSNTGGSKRKPAVPDPVYYYDDPAEIRVEAVVLDDFLADQYFDMIVMDIEGSEYFALLGMQRLLSQAQILQLEFLPHHLTQISDVSIEAFVATLAPHFRELQIPSLKRTVSQSAFLAVLSEMFAREQEDDGLIFLK